jgi:CubicO group peptidase (beta-lactamase class C family)
MGYAARHWLVLALLFALAGPAGAQDKVRETASCGAPAAIGDGWALQTSVEAGFDPKSLCEIDAIIGRSPEANVHAVNVVRHGKLVLELYYRGQDMRWGSPLGVVPLAPDVKHDLRSISKSVTSMLVGIAAGDGRFPALEQPVLDTLTDYADLGTAEKRRITLHHLLTMSAGLAWDETSNAGEKEDSWWHMITARDPVRYVLEQPMTWAPGAVFTYSSGDTTVLGRALTRATGQRLDDFARTRLFDPLGISDFEWGPLHATGETAAASGLRMRPRDLAKLGQVMLKDGMWGERRVLPTGWAAESLRPRIKTAGAYRYGYQWWTGETSVEGGSVAWAAGFGWGGQRLYLVPSLDLVVVVTAGLYEPPYSRMQDRMPKQIFDQVIRSAR